MGVKKAEASGNNPIENLIKPKPPSFKRTPAKITEPAVGASQCASGSQIWNGMRGILTANDKKKANQQQRSVNVSNWIALSVWRSVVPKEK